MNPKLIERDDIKFLAERLYFNLPWWKRRSVARWYKSNNWDVTGAWKDCISQAQKMVQDRNYQLKDYVEAIHHD